MKLAVVAVIFLATLPTAQAREFTIHAGADAGGALAFRPRDLRAEEGEVVAITLVNDDADTPHDWAILDYGGLDVEVFARGGRSNTVDFVADTPGVFRIICQVVGHKQRGMEGEFTVDKDSLVPDAGPLAPAVLALAALAWRRRWPPA